MIHSKKIKFLNYFSFIPRKIKKIDKKIKDKISIDTN